MARTKISEFSATPGNNTDIDGINIAEGCAPSGINDAIRELMSQLKDFQAGTAGDSFNGPVGTTTAAAGAFTTLSASSTVSGAGFSTYLASPPAIGGTAAAAGSFTTLSASSTVTLSGGTANGVLYLNGSKVATSGSALTFDGTRLGVGASPNAGYNAAFVSQVGADTGTSGLMIRGADGYLSFDSGVAGYGTTGLYGNAGGGTSANSYLVFRQNGSEQMRLTSTGLGIGTSSPAYKLDVNGTASIQGITLGFDGTYTSPYVTLGFSGNTNGSTRIFATNNNSDNLYLAAGTGRGVTIWTNGSSTNVATFDSSGNLGLGVTPSAWSTGKAFEAGYVGNAFWGNSSDECILTQSAYYNAGWKYARTGAATQYSQYNGSHRWFYAASGTAGNAISFTQALTLDASGALLVGDTTAPSNGIVNAAVSTKGQGTSGNRRATASAMGVTASLAQNATANTYSFGGYGGYGLFVAEGSDPNAAWRAAAIVWSTGAALTILNLGSTNITVGSSGTTITVQNTSATSEAISWSMLVLG